MPEILKYKERPLSDEALKTKSSMSFNAPNGNEDYLVNPYRQHNMLMESSNLLKPEDEPRLAQIMEKGRIANTILTLVGRTDLKSRNLSSVGNKSAANISLGNTLRHFRELDVSLYDIRLSLKEEDMEARDLDVYLKNQSKNPQIKPKTLVIDHIEIKDPEQTRKKLNLPKLNEAMLEGEKARQDFISANLKLISSIIRQKYAHHEDTLSLFQEGNIGLIRAVDKFEWRKGFKFSTYASQWIRQAINRSIMSNSNTIRVSENRQYELSKVERTRIRLRQASGSDPSNDEIAHVLGWPIERVKNIIKSTSKVQGIVSLDAPSINDEKNTMTETIPTDRLSPEEEAEKQDMTDIVRNELRRSLKDRELRVLALRFGLIDGKQRLFREIGSELGISGVRAGQIHAGAIKKLQNPETMRILEGYDE